MKAVVIGAGIGGLASAIRLANKGFEVTVFENNSYPGGKCDELSGNGYRFDTGPSLLTMPELIDELFVLSGKNPKDYFEYEKLNVLCNYFWDDSKSLSFTSNIDITAKEIEVKFNVKAQKVIKHVKESEYIYKQTAHLFLEKSLHKIKSYLNLKTIKSILNLPFLHIFKSINYLNKKKLKNPYLTQLFNRYATYNGSNPYKASGILHIIPHLEINKGAFYPKGGMIQISNSLYQLALDIGVKFNFNQKVNEIIVKNKKAIGVKVNEQIYHAKVVVSNMDVVLTYKNLLLNQKQPFKILNQERSSSALIFYWGIKQKFNTLDLHNIFFSSNYEEEFDYIFNKKSVFNDPTVYINITSKHSENDAPANCENWFVMINVPHLDNQNWDDIIIKSKENILKKLSKNLNTNIENLIDFEDILTPKMIESKTFSYLG